ncbi:hypothetical protein QVD17_26129 [Tagetes erecta]|uniref:Protein kinase domain-containing protein n=1 Tax=Tagetes erecta TaxID=13708 RepID=A0AAD8K6A4_TARER|nr:hypothetical protein QVD17_26129 [Tagetes erecta]
MYIKFNPIVVMMNTATGEGANTSSCHLFSLEEIKSATTNFDDKQVIEHGGFVKVYKGEISGEKEKSNRSGESSGTMGFSWKINHMSGTSSPNCYGNNLNQHEELVITELRVFTYDEVKLATREFENRLSLYDSSNGMVYKGWMDKTASSSCKDDTGLPIVVKKLDYKLFNLETLKKFRHPNIVKLIGYSLKGEYPGGHFLVYEFMPKGSFEDLLNSGAAARLPLVTKVKILAGIARGIVFLQKPQFNRKIWPKIGESKLDRCMILFDEDYTPKLWGYVYDYYNPPSLGVLSIVLRCNLSGYKVILVEVLTGTRMYSSKRVEKINRMFSHYGKQSLDRIAELCFEMCNEMDLESNMLTMLKEQDELIQERLESWLKDPKN